jgi:hypothetical protein
LPSICANRAPVDFYTATSSTSTGRALLVPHCRAEYRALGADPNGGGAPTRQLVRNDVAADAGGPADGCAARRRGTILATYEANAVRETRVDIWDYIAGQVFIDFPSPSGGRPVTTIHATPALGLILLTKYMLQRGIDPRESAVRSLVVTGSWIGPETARWLAEAWDGRLDTTYSCSELTGGVVACPKHRGRYHFAANLLTEVLDDAGHPVAYGKQGRIPHDRTLSLSAIGDLPAL